MTLLQSILLGIIQGLTEFLPISSSAHLVLTPFFLGWQIPYEQNFIFGVLVQVGTLAAVIAYFWRDLYAIIKGVLLGLVHRHPLETPEARMGWLIVLASIPAGLLGLLIKDMVEAAFNSPVATAFFLLVTAVLLQVAERIGKRLRALDSLNWKDALIIGFWQAAAIFPGISRSGATITGGMIRQLDRPSAARFSFLMSVPIMLAAGLLAGKDLLGMPSEGSFLPVVIVGMLTSAVVGYLSIRWLLRYLVNHSLSVFSIYCAVLGVVALIVAYAR